MKKFIKSLSNKNADELLACLPKKSYLKEMELYAAQNNVPIVDKVNGALLIHLIEFKRPLKILEIGTGLGFSTSLMRDVLFENGVLVTVDHSYPSIIRAKHFCGLEDTGKKIYFVRGSGVEILNSVQKQFDIIFIDCNKQDYFELLYLGLKKLTPNGLLLFDNVSFWDKTRVDMNREKFERIRKRVKFFLSEVCDLKGIHFKILEQGDGLLVVYKETI